MDAASEARTFDYGRPLKVIEEEDDEVLTCWESARDTIKTTDYSFLWFDFFALLAASCAAVAGVIVHALVADTLLWGLPLYKYFYFCGIWLAAIPLQRFGNFIFFWLLSLPVGPRAPKPILACFYYANAFNGALGYIVWTAIAFPLFAAFFEPTRQSDRVFSILVIAACLYAVKDVLVRILFSRARDKEFQGAIGGVMKRLIVLQNLSSVSMQKVVGLRKPSADLAAEEVQPAITAAKAKGLDEASIERMQQISRFVKEFKFRVFNRKGKLVVVTSAMGASKVAKSVFRGITKGDTIEESDLKGYLDDADIDAVFSVLKEEINRSIHNRTFEVFVRTLYADYKSLTRSVTDFSSVNKALQALFACVYGFVLVIITLLVYQVPFSEFVVSAGSILVAISFAFGGAIKEFIDSLVFIIVQKPYNVGDRVSIAHGETMYVHQIDIKTTTFRTLHGKLTQYPNAYLSTTAVQNHRRSTTAFIESIWHVGYKTTPEQLDQLQSAQLAFIRARKHIWREDIVESYIYGTNSRGMLTIAVWLCHRATWQDGVLIWADVGNWNMFTLHAMNTIGIEFIYPSQPVRMEDFNAGDRGLSGEPWAEAGSTLHGGDGSARGWMLHRPRSTAPPSYWDPSNAPSEVPLYSQEPNASFGGRLASKASDNNMLGGQPRAATGGSVLRSGKAPLQVRSFDHLLSLQNSSEYASRSRDKLRGGNTPPSQRMQDITDSVQPSKLLKREDHATEWKVVSPVPRRPSTNVVPPLVKLGEPTVGHQYRVHRPGDLGHSELHPAAGYGERHSPIPSESSSAVKATPALASAGPSFMIGDGIGSPPEGQLTPLALDYSHSAEDNSGVVYGFSSSDGAIQSMPATTTVAQSMQRVPSMVVHTSWTAAAQAASPAEREIHVEMDPSSVVQVPTTVIGSTASQPTLTHTTASASPLVPSLSDPPVQGSESPMHEDDAIRLVDPRQPESVKPGPMLKAPGTTRAAVVPDSWESIAHPSVQVIQPPPTTEQIGVGGGSARSRKFGMFDDDKSVYTDAAIDDDTGFDAQRFAAGYVDLRSGPYAHTWKEATPYHKRVAVLKRPTEPVPILQAEKRLPLHAQFRQLRLDRAGAAQHGGLFFLGRRSSNRRLTTHRSQSQLLRSKPPHGLGTNASSGSVVTKDSASARGDSGSQPGRHLWRRMFNAHREKSKSEKSVTPAEELLHGEATARLRAAALPTDPTVTAPPVVRTARPQLADAVPAVSLSGGPQFAAQGTSTSGSKPSGRQST